MGWNGSNKIELLNSQNAKSRIDGSGSHSVRTELRHRYRLSIAVIFAAIVGAAVWYFFTHNEGKNIAKQNILKAPAKIVEVVPCISTNAMPVEPKKPKHKLELRKVADGLVMLYRDGKEAWLYPHQDEGKYGVITTSLAQTSHQLEDRLFSCPTDVQLAYIANYEPGEPFGDGLDTRHFTRLFLKSLDTPIEITDMDSPEEAKLKKGVIELRAELKRRYDAGEDIEKIVNETIEDCQRLGEYKLEIERQIEKYSRTAEATEADVDQFIEMANKMLEEKGLSRSEMPALMRKRLQIKFKKQTKGSEQ